MFFSFVSSRIGISGSNGFSGAAWAFRCSLKLVGVNVLRVRRHPAMPETRLGGKAAWRGAGVPGKRYDRKAAKRQSGKAGRREGGAAAPRHEAKTARRRGGLVR